MARGPKPNPAAVAAQKAPVRSTRRRPDPAEHPVRQGLSPPDWLVAENGLEVWDRLAPTLTMAKLITTVDVHTFARYCRNFARWLKMQAALDAGTETYTVETASGVVHRPRPEFLIADRIERQLLGAEDRFGLNPAERQRIMAARAQTGVSGDLFANPVRPDAGPAAKAAAGAKPIEGPIGLLN